MGQDETDYGSGQDETIDDDETDNVTPPEKYCPEVEDISQYSDFDDWFQETEFQDLIDDMAEVADVETIYSDPAFRKIILGIF